MLLLSIYYIFVFKTTGSLNIIMIIEYYYYLPAIPSANSRLFKTTPIPNVWWFGEPWNATSSHLFYVTLKFIDKYVEYIQWTINVMRLLTVGGTPLEAMHRYEPICCLVTRWNVRIGLSTTATEKHDNTLPTVLVLQAEKYFHFFSFNCILI